jgi:hypothetical protein
VEKKCSEGITMEAEEFIAGLKCEAKRALQKHNKKIEK